MESKSTSPPSSTTHSPAITLTIRHRKMWKAKRGKGKTWERKSSHSMTTTLRSSQSTPDLPPGTDLYVEAGLLRVGTLARYPELLHGISVRHAPDGDDWNLSARR